MWQTLMVVLIVLVAAAYVGRRAWRTLRPVKSAGCAHDCGCGDASGGEEQDWARTR